MFGKLGSLAKFDIGTIRRSFVFSFSTPPKGRGRELYTLMPFHVALMGGMEEYLGRKIGK
jgi:hypothetical protein